MPDNIQTLAPTDGQSSGLSVPTGYASPEEMLIADNKRLREAGCELAEAAMRVAKTYDGVHRLMLACSKWALAIANEGGRERYQHNTEVTQMHSEDGASNPPSA